MQANNIAALSKIWYIKLTKYIINFIIMKKMFFYFTVALVSVVVMSCGNCGSSAEGNAYADSVMNNIRKYDQVALNNNETSVDVYVKSGEKPDGVYDIENFFYISFVDANAPKYTGKRFLNHPDSKIDDKGKLINKTLRHYVVHLDKGEMVIKINLNHVTTTKRTINIHYIYE